MLLPGSDALPNGYNRIHEVAIPALVIVFAMVYTGLALVPAALVHLVITKAVRGSSPRFARSYAGAVAGGETGIGLSYAFSKWCAGPGWTSYHYTLYPYLILGLSIAAAVLLSLMGARKKSEH